MSVYTLRKKKEQGDPIVAVTAYDARMAELAEEAGIDLLLVGDSVGMTTLGYESTVPVTLEASLHHTSAVARGAYTPLIVGDMPFLTYNVSVERALLNAGRYLQEAGADAVKLEGGASISETIRRMVTAGIPVMAHIGLLPQGINTEGRYRIRGRNNEEAQRLIDDAHAVEESGAFAVVCEGMAHDLAADISSKLQIPVIGIGAGGACDGQIQVVHDILGLFEKFVPKHTKRYVDLSAEIRDALQQYKTEIKKGDFPPNQ